MNTALNPTLTHHAKTLVAACLLTAALCTGDLRAAQNASIRMRPTPAPAVAPADSGKLLHVTLMNMSAHRRQAMLCNGAAIELPVGERVVLETYAGATIRVVSDDDAKLRETFVVNTNSAARVLAVH